MDHDAFHGYVYDDGTAVCLHCCDAEHDADLARLTPSEQAAFAQATGLSLATGSAAALRQAWIDRLIERDGAWPRDTARYLDAAEEADLDLDTDLATARAAVGGLNIVELADLLTDIRTELCGRCGVPLATVSDDPDGPVALLTALVEAARLSGLLAEQACAG